MNEAGLQLTYLLLRTNEDIYLFYLGFGVTFGFLNLSVFLYIKTHTPPNMVQVGRRGEDLYVWCYTAALS